MFPNSSLKGTRLEVRVFWEVFGQENVLPISTLQEDEGKIILARLQWEYLREGAVVLMLADDFVNPAANRNLKVSKSLTNEKFAWKCVLGKFEPTRELLVPIDTNKCAVSWQLQMAVCSWCYAGICVGCNLLGGGCGLIYRRSNEPIRHFFRNQDPQSCKLNPPEIWVQGPQSPGASAEATPKLVNKARDLSSAILFCLRGWQSSTLCKQLHLLGS